MEVIARNNFVSWYSFALIGTLADVRIKLVLNLSAKPRRFDLTFVLLAEEVTASLASRLIAVLTGGIGCRGASLFAKVSLFVVAVARIVWKDASPKLLGVIFATFAVTHGISTCVDSNMWAVVTIAFECVPILASLQEILLSGREAYTC